MCLANQNEQKFNIFLSNPEMQPQKGFTTWNSSILVGRVLKKHTPTLFQTVCKTWNLLDAKGSSWLTPWPASPKFRFLHPSCF
jgi:hypothetical protein